MTEHDPEEKGRSEEEKEEHAERRESEWKESMEHLSDTAKKEGFLLLRHLRTLQKYYAERSKREKMLFHLGLLVGLLLGWAVLNIFPWWIQLILLLYVGWMAWKSLMSAARTEWGSKNPEKDREATPENEA